MGGAKIISFLSIVFRYLQFFVNKSLHLPISPLYFIESLYHINANIQRICDSFSDMEKIQLLVEFMFENQACLFNFLSTF